MNNRERRAVLLMIPLIAVAVWIIYSAWRPRADASAEMLGDVMVSETGSGGAARSSRSADDSPLPSLFAFDPNTVTYEELRQLGFAKNTAAGIIKYRQRGKVFEIPEDFATCYGVTDSIYAMLKPYINIGEQWRPKPRAGNPRDVANSSPGKVDNTAPQKKLADLPSSVDPNSLTVKGFESLGFSPRQAEVIVRYRESIGGFKTPSDLAACYVVSDEMFALLAPIISISEPASPADIKTELNTADSAALISIRGIGPRSASDILEYRARLGGFSDPQQLAEVASVTERNFELIMPQIWVDSCVIQKIDINFASPNTVGKHPYLSGKLLRKVLKNRQLKGGWSNIEDMVEDNTLTPHEARKLAPYLHFAPAAGN